jgi:hypothetical protein
VTRPGPRAKGQGPGPGARGQGPGAGTVPLVSRTQAARDDTLINLAQRIQGRAIRRQGELLREIPEAKGANQNITEGTLPNVQTRTQAARDAGISERGQKTAMRVSAIPEAEYERLMEGERGHLPRVLLSHHGAVPYRSYCM